MEAVSSITAHIAQVQSRIAQVRTASVSFDAVLGGVLTQQSARASTTTSATGLATTTTLGASVDAVGSGADQVDAKGVPLELKAYGNGTIPTGTLSTVGNTNHRLWTPAARSFEALQTAAAADGVTIGITDSYRTYDSQVSLAKSKGLYSKGGLAAAPGTSMHGWGVALDLDLNSSAQTWMRANAGRFGFVENVSREPWHWQYVPTT